MLYLGCESKTGRWWKWWSVLSTLALPFYQSPGNKIETLVTNKGYNIHGNRMARCLEGNIGEGKVKVSGIYWGCTV